MPSFIQPEYTVFYDQVAAIVGNKKVTAENVVYLAGSAMQIVDKQKEMTGLQKKNLVINIIKEVVRNQKSIKKDEKQMIYIMIDQLVPGAIDLIVAGANGELGINENEVKGCLPCLNIKKKTKVENNPENANNKARTLFNDNSKKNRSKKSKR